MVSHRFCIASGIHDDNIIRRGARILDPLLKQCTTVLVCDNFTLSSSRRAIDAGALTRHRTSRAESLVQQVDVTNLTFHVLEGVAVVFRKR
jgi:predicted ATP-grasp superfamily ATP-dependent carboligase